MLTHNAPLDLYPSFLSFLWTRTHTHTRTHTRGGTLFSPASAADFHPSIVFEDTFLLENVPSDTDRHGNGRHGNKDDGRGSDNDGSRTSRGISRQPRKSSTESVKHGSHRRSSAPVVSKGDAFVSKHIRSKGKMKDLSFSAYTGSANADLAEEDDHGGEYDVDAWCETTSFSS